MHLHHLVLLKTFGDRPLLELDADRVDAVPLVRRGHALALELRWAKATGKEKWPRWVSEFDAS